MSMYDIKAVVSKVDSALSSKNIEEARKIFKEELMDWEDYYQENLSSDPQSDESIEARKAIPELWIAYAKMEVSNKQFKSALQVFDDALNNSFAKASLEVYLAYADYCRHRGRVSNEQKVYLLGLTSTMPQKDIDTLWHEYLKFTESHQNKSLKMSEFVEAVVKDQGESSNQIKRPSEYLLVDVNSRDSSEIVVSESKYDESSSNNTNELMVQSESKSDEDHNASISISEGSLESLSFSPSDRDFDDISDIPSDHLIKMFGYCPPSLFSAADKDPLNRGLQNIDDGLRVELSAFLQIPLEEIVNGGPISPHASLMLDIVESMWYEQSLKERQYDAWISLLKMDQLPKEQEYKSRLEELLQSNPIEAKRYELTNRRNMDRLVVQREVLSAIINKSKLSLLVEQQKLLYSCGCPHFSLEFLSRLESYLMSPLGKVINTSLIWSNDPEIEAMVNDQRIVVCSLLSLRWICPNSRFPMELLPINNNKSRSEDMAVAAHHNRARVLSSIDTSKIFNTNYRVAVSDGKKGGFLRSSVF